MILVGDAFAMVVREQNIVINSIDMNIILTTIQSHPAVKRAATSLPICLPGVSDEGFLYLTIKYMNPLIGIIYTSLSQDQFTECLEEANLVTIDLEKEGIAEKLNLAYTKYYVTPVISYGNFI
jgi:hypothetical protein